MRTTLALLTACLAPTAAFAHPHIFAEARMEIVEGKDGMIAEIRNIWRFDDMFSASVVMDFDKNGDMALDAEELAEIGETVRESLADYSYYTFVSVDNKQAELQKPDAIHVSYQDGRILMFFAMQPQKPLPLKGTLSFGAWDPTLYTAIDFAKDGDLVTQGKDFAACKQQVVRPDADEVIAQNQANLTAAFFNDPAGTNTAKLFATRLELTC